MGHKKPRKGCILKWLKQTNNLKCPQCNAKAKKTDVRVIYAKSLRTIDTSERDRALDDLRKEKEMRRKAEIDVAQANLRYRMAIEEMNRLKEQINAQRNQLKNTSPDRPEQFFACSGDEATSSALIWDTTSGSQVQKLTINSTVLDVCPFQFNRQSFLAALTDKQVKLYTWRPTKRT